MHYTIAKREDMTSLLHRLGIPMEWWTVEGPGLKKLCHYATENDAKKAAALFEGIYIAGRADEHESLKQSGCLREPR